jgi:hypothetical protein
MLDWNGLALYGKRERKKGTVSHWPITLFFCDTGY